MCIRLVIDRHVTIRSTSPRLESVVDFARGHNDQRIFHLERRVGLFLALPDLVQALATDTAAEMGMELDFAGWISRGILTAQSEGPYLDFRKCLGEGMVNRLREIHYHQVLFCS